MSRGVKWARRVAVAVAASSMVVVGLILPAGAAEVISSGPIAAGESVTLSCPAGDEFVSGSADFWRKLSGNAAHYLGSAQFVASGDGTSATAGPAPKGAKFFSATINCQPIPETTQTVTPTGPYVPGEEIRVLCPPETPYVVSVGEAVIYDPITGETIHLAYEPVLDAEGRVIGISSTPTDARAGWNWRVVMTCSSVPSTPTEQVVTQTGQGTGSSFSVDCPSDYPYLRSVFEVVTVNPTTGQTSFWTYETTETGVLVDAVSTAWNWRVSLYCSSLPQ